LARNALLLAAMPVFAAGSCGHNKVRHIQHAQLQKVHGEDYELAHQLYEQRRKAGPATAVSSNGHSTARRLHASTATKQPTTRLQKLLQDNQASTLRIQPVYQLEESFLSAQQSAQVRDVLVPGAIKILQQYIKVGVQQVLLDTVLNLQPAN
jgi:hypothetical protein